MTGLPFALAPFVVACLVARRKPAHRPVRDALGASASFSLWTVVDVHFAVNGFQIEPYVGLALFALVALASGRAYARAFGWRWTEGRIVLVPATALAGMVLVRPFIGWWVIATWGPFAASSVFGALAVWAWSSERLRHPMYAIRHGEEPRRVGFGPVAITQRVALVLLASDVCMLAFIPWGGVQMWQGRAAAVAVALVQVTALRRPKPDTRSAP
jgi:UPF0716 family protein affecting phage T7 exclusion